MHNKSKVSILEPKHSQTFGTRIFVMIRNSECIPLQCQPQADDCRSEWNMHALCRTAQNSLAYFSITIVEFTNTFARNVDDSVHVYRNTLSTFRIRIRCIARYKKLYSCVYGWKKNNFAIREYSIIMHGVFFFEEIRSILWLQFVSRYDSCSFVWIASSKSIQWVISNDVHWWN